MAGQGQDIVGNLLAVWLHFVMLSLLACLTAMIMQILTSCIQRLSAPP